MYKVEIKTSDIFNPPVINIDDYSCVFDMSREPQLTYKANLAIIYTCLYYLIWLRFSFSR